VIAIPQSVVRNPKSGRIKVLHLITDLDPGGAEWMLFKLISAMDQTFFENGVVSMADLGIVGKRLEELGIKVWTLGMKKGVPSLRGSVNFFKILKTEKPVILQTWMYHADLLGTLARIRYRSLKLIWNIRCGYMDFSQYRRMTLWVVKLCARLSSLPEAVIVNATEGKEQHQRLGYHPKRWELIPNGFDLQRFNLNPEARIAVRKELGLGEETLLIGMAARFDPMKDHQNFLSAASALAEENSNVCFLLLGEGITGENPFFRTYLNHGPLSGRLFLLGFREDVARITAALDIATLSSFGEGFPNAIGEAMACRIPCVVTDVGDSAYLVGDCGEVVPPRDPKGLLEAWKKLLNLSSHDRQTLGLRARKRVKNNFDLKIIAESYKKLYLQVLGKPIAPESL
jgi:glycosyltransferase involved in cell wall biosynthesis